MTARRSLAAFGAATMALFVPLALLDRRMQRAGGPGIIPFELVGTPARAAAVMDAWGEDGRRAARLSLLLDFPFLVAYSGLNVAVARALGSPRWTTVAAVGAGACDAVENAALLGVLGGRGGGRLPAVARSFALAKFALLGAGWVDAAARIAVRR
jgi:hypothetical protein